MSILILSDSGRVAFFHLSWPDTNCYPKLIRQKIGKKSGTKQPNKWLKLPKKNSNKLYNTCEMQHKVENGSTNVM
jgi:hypothetical protein